MCVCVCVSCVVVLACGSLHLLPYFRHLSVKKFSIRCVLQWVCRTRTSRNYNNITRCVCRVWLYLHAFQFSFKHVSNLSWTRFKYWLCEFHFLSETCVLLCVSYIFLKENGIHVTCISSVSEPILNHMSNCSQTFQSLLCEFHISFFRHITNSLCMF